MLDAKKARKELAKKTLEDIEHETAITWGSRAVASYQLAHEARGAADAVRRFAEGETYRQEALEHAAMVEDEAHLVALIADEIGAEREPARRHVEALLGGAD
jgi:N-methylhydantoinase A/oxoprolinase/acetone carboxylase beta subunit